MGQKGTLISPRNASLEAIAAVAYIKATRNHETKTIFLMGKRRKAPLPQNTIAKLELQSTPIAARLKETTEDKVSFEFEKIFLWSDFNVKQQLPD